MAQNILLPNGAVVGSTYSRDNWWSNGRKGVWRAWGINAGSENIAYFTNAFEVSATGLAPNADYELVYFGHGTMVDGAVTGSIGSRSFVDANQPIDGFSVSDPVRSNSAGEIRSVIIQPPKPSGNVLRPTYFFDDGLIETSDGSGLYETAIIETPAGGNNFTIDPQQLMASRLQEAHDALGVSMPWHTTVDYGNGEENAELWCIRQTHEFQLTLRRVGVPGDINTVVRANYIFCNNITPEGVDLWADFTPHLFTIPVDFDLGAEQPEWSPNPCWGDEGDSEYSDEIIQRFNTNPTNKNQYLECLEISHPDFAQPFYIVNDRNSHDLNLEDGSTQTFQPYGFAVNLPQTDRGGLKDMNITVDNTDRFLSDFIETIKVTEKPTTIIYRIYTADDPTTNHLQPPFQMTLTDLTINTFQLSGKTQLIDFINSTFLKDDYDRKRFPSLGS